jgi:deazaflavin-dependent oxidoreductase (nitroreductase family)
MSEANNWNHRIIEEFRANRGKVGGFFEGQTLLLLHHRGAKTGVTRVNPVAYQAVGDAFAIFASNGGHTKNPDWYHNLVAHPEVTVELGTESFLATARVATGEERERIWEAQKTALPHFAEYEQTAGREIPVIVLERA